MKTILIPCQVPWSISPSVSGVTLTHCETPVEPECFVGLGGNGLSEDRSLCPRRIEIIFSMCYYARVGPNDDSVGIESIGYKIEQTYRNDPEDYHVRWQRTGNCPDSGFYVAKQSVWLSTLDPFFQKDFQHYVIDGRDGYVELIARHFAWKEWLWDQSWEEAINAPVISSGQGVT